MSSLNGIQRFLTGALVSFAGCVGLQATAFFLLHFGSGKSESNYFSTISRFQGAVAPGAEIAVVGSSISGRLPGRESGNKEVANLGSDGGSPLDGLSLLNEGLAGKPRWLVLEINTVFSSVGFAETPAVAGSRGPWFKIGGALPLLGASARPTGMLYGRLLGRKWEGVPAPFHLQHVPSPIPGPPLRGDTLTALEKDRIRRLGEGLIRAKNSGTRILLVRYPAGPMWQTQVNQINTTVSLLHHQTGAFYLDLNSEIPRSEMVFTDNVHLGPESAARILATIRDACRQLEEKAP